MHYSDLTDAQKAKARACKTSDDLVVLAKSEGVELTDDQLEAIAGGAWYGCTSNEDLPEDIPM